MKNKQDNEPGKQETPPVKPEKHIPAKPDKNPDPSKHDPGPDPEKVDPTRIEEPGKVDPTRIDPDPGVNPPKQDLRQEEIKYEVKIIFGKNGKIFEKITRQGGESNARV
jgi:hypothetical protein